METGRPYSRLLLRLERFGALSASDRQRIAGLPLKLANYPADREVLRYGYSPPRCTLVLDGFLNSHKLVAGSRRHIISFFVPGDIADLPTLYSPKIDYGISTIGQAALAFVPQRTLKEVLAESPPLAQAFWRETMMQAAISREWVIMGRRDALARAAHIICELTMRLQTIGLARDLSFSMPWTQRDLADACGISNVHANRVVQELRLRGLVQWKSKRIKVRDWNSLVQLGDFNDDYLQFGISTTREPPLSGQSISQWA